MKIVEYEKAILSVMLRFHSGNDNIPQRICAELDFDKFDPTKINGRIYKAIQKVVIDRGIPNIPNIARALGKDLTAIGGEEYLQSLIGFLPMMGVHDFQGFDTWVRLVDSAGRLRQLGRVLDKYTNLYTDFETLVNKVENVDEFVAKFLEEINEGIGSLPQTYQHISSAVAEERRRISRESKGHVVDLIPMGWPSMAKFFIPRPATLGVIAGITSMGKTQFALQMLLGVAMYLHKNKLPGCVAINELEMQGWRLNRRLACCLTGVNGNDLATGKVDEITMQRYNKTLDYLEELPIFLDDNPSLTSTKLIWNAVALHMSHGPRILGISDYLELFSDEGENEELRVSQVVRNQRKVCWETGSCEVAISQFNSSVMLTNSKIGGIGRTRYSGAIGHAADWFIEVYNPPQMRRAGIDFSIPDGMEDDRAYFMIQKNKDHAIGREAFDWIPEFTQFRDMALATNEVFRIPNVVREEDF